MKIKIRFFIFDISSKRGNAKCAIAFSSDGIHWTGYNDGNFVNEIESLGVLKPEKSGAYFLV